MIAGVLLAAGRGRRMGGTKQLLPWPPGTGVTTLVAAAFDAIAPACDEMLVVVDHEAEAVVDALGDRSFSTVRGRADADMYESVRVGLAAAASRGAVDVVLQPGDHPAVATATLDALRAARKVHPDHVILPDYGGRGGHPVLIPTGVVDALLAYGGEGGLRAFLREHPDLCHRVLVSDPGVVRDIDRPSDVEPSR